MSTMKVLLVLTILHASGIIDIGTNAAAVIVKRGDFTPEMALARINKERNKVAKQLGITNMNPLIWSKELAAKADKIPLDCSKVEDGRDYRYFIMEKSSNPHVNRNLTISEMRNDPYFFPSQIEVGCNLDFSCHSADGRKSWEGLCFVRPQMNSGPDRSENKPIIESSQSDTHSAVQVTETPENKEDPDSTDGASSSISILSCLFTMLLMI